MKKIKYFICGLAVAFVYGRVDSFAQTKWLPERIETFISVPAIISHRDWSECPGSTHNTSYNDSVGIGAGIYGGGTIFNYSNISDSFFISWSFLDGYFFSSISFILDRSGKRILNLKIDEGRTADGFSWWESSMYCSAEIPYTISVGTIGDTTITAKVSGSQMIGKITVNKWNRTTWGNCNVRLAHYGTNDDIVSLLQDTSRYQCSLVLYNEKPVNGVNKEKTNKQNFIILNADHLVFFSFPSSDHSQPLTIYDILGREVKRIEIPSGASEYRLQRDGFMSGYYFARLGNLGAKFVVSSQ